MAQFQGDEYLWKSAGQWPKGGHLDSGCPLASLPFLTACRLYLFSHSPLLFILSPAILCLTSFFQTFQP